jgi:hypothetical protein
VTGASTITPDHISWHKPGSVFEDDLDPVQEERWVQGGHITRIEDEPRFDQHDLGQPEAREE